MGQIHKRFTGEQVSLLFGAYVQGHMKHTDVQEALTIGKSRLFELLPSSPAVRRRSGLHRM
jgi:hypothetical protein